MKYRIDGFLKSVPLPWRYDANTRNIIAGDGSIVCRCGDSVHADPEIGCAIVRVFNNQFALFERHKIIPRLIAVARSAYSLIDDACDEDDILTVDRADFNDLSNALNALDDFPDPPGEAATGPRKAEYWSCEAPQELF